MSLSFDFSGKVVLITGSSSGIGGRTALKFSEAGAQLAITGLTFTSNDLALVANNCLDISPKNLKPQQILADISKEEDCKRLIESVIDEFGKLDILVNCAGIASLSNINDKDYIDIYKMIFETNLNSVIYLTHYSVEHLEKTNGNIVNISSAATIDPVISTYCMSKCAIDMFTKCMAVELGSKHIRVNSILPGLIKTNIGADTKLEQFVNKESERYAEIYPVGRVGNVDDIAHAIMYLSSNQASFITGINFVVDGGLVAYGIRI